MTEKDIEHLKFLSAKDKEVKKIYDQLIQELSKIGVSINNLSDYTESGVFSFSDYPAVKDKVDALLLKYNEKMQDWIVLGMRDAVNLSWAANSELLKGFSPLGNKAVMEHRETAKNAFIANRVNTKDGLNLSQRVWNYTQQTKVEFEAAMTDILSDGIESGMSAEELGRRIRGRLNDPEAMYRRYHTKKLTSSGQKKDVIEWRKRVVDENGKVRFVKVDMEKVGRGNYRSSRQNTLRLAGTEINMAYRYADCKRWESEPFVTGIRIRLSGNHPVVDICDELAGDYPKTFLWSGWHPRCRCSASPILISKEEMNRISDLSKEEYENYKPEGLITDMPPKFNEWMEKNADRIAAAAERDTLPYFLKDNRGKNLGIFDEYIKENSHMKARKKTPEEKAAIQKAWEERKKHAELIRKVSGKVGVVAMDYKEIDLSDLVKYRNLNDTKNMEMEMKRIAKQVSMIKKDEKFLSQLIPDVKGWKEQFTSDDLHKVYDAVQTKMDGWKFLPTDTKFDKLMFEVEWVTKAKKYPTWNVAASAYQKQLEAVQVIIQKKSINESIQDALLYSKTTKSTHLKKLVEQYSQMLAKGTDNVSELLNQSGKINAKYEALLKDKATRVAKTAGKNTIVHNPDAFSQERKDAALWAKSPKAADKKMRDVCGKVWREASENERDAAFFYTHTFSSINEPLRGITYCGEKSLSVARGHVPHLTSIINKSKYDFDLWLQRGVDDGRNMLKVYLDGMTESEVKDMFLGTVIQDEGFISCGNSKGKGFAHRSVIFNIYCPKGTKGLYLEPFSKFGMGAKRSWDGISAQDYFGDEAEMLLQRGTKFRITKIEKAASKWYIDMEVVEQPI